VRTWGGPPCDLDSFLTIVLDNGETIERQHYWIGDEQRENKVRHAKSTIYRGAIPEFGNG
jgi:hypothetical protein